MDDQTMVTAAVTRRRRKTSQNTCAPSSQTKRLTRQLAGIMAHLEQHPSDALSRARVSRIEELLRSA